MQQLAPREDKFEEEVTFVIHKYYLLITWVPFHILQIEYWVPTIHVVLHEDTDGLDASAVKIKLVICSLPPMSESLFEDVE